MNQHFRERLGRAIVAGVLTLATLFWLGTWMRFVSLPFLVIGWGLYFRKRPSVRPALICLLFFIPLTFSPVDVMPVHRKWPPKLVPLVMGLPTRETAERARKGEVILGGCIVSGFEPKYYLVW